MQPSGTITQQLCLKRQGPVSQREVQPAPVQHLLPQDSNKRTNKQPVLSVLSKSHSENRQSGEFFLLQGVGGGGSGGGGAGKSTTDSDGNLQVLLQQRSSVQAGPVVCLLSSSFQFPVVQQPAENDRSQPYSTRTLKTQHVCVHLLADGF